MPPVSYLIRCLINSLSLKQLLTVFFSVSDTSLRRILRWIQWNIYCCCKPETWISSQGRPPKISLFLSPPPEWSNQEPPLPDYLENAHCLCPLKLKSNNYYRDNRVPSSHFRVTPSRNIPTTVIFHCHSGRHIISVILLRQPTIEIILH